MSPNEATISVHQLASGKWFVVGTVWISDSDQFRFWGKREGETNFNTNYDDHVEAQRVASGMMMELALDRTAFLAKYGYRQNQ